MKAKFECQSVERFANAEKVNLVPVTSGSEENKSFSLFTPVGKLEMMVTNPEAFGKIVPGKSYYLDITEAP